MICFLIFSTEYILLEYIESIILPNNSWTGLMGRIQRQEMDIMMRILSESKLMEIGDFLRVIYPDR